MKQIEEYLIANAIAKAKLIPANKKIVYRCAYLKLLTQALPL